MKTVEQIISEIARRNFVAIENRGDLETRRNDEEDFVDVAVWELRKALMEAYKAGKGEKNGRSKN